MLSKLISNGSRYLHHIVSHTKTVSTNYSSSIQCLQINNQRLFSTTTKTNEATTADTNATDNDNTIEAETEPTNVSNDQVNDASTADSNAEAEAEEDSTPHRLFVGGESSDSPIIEREMWVEAMTPQKIVDSLDRHIIGQNKAKKSVAISLRNRWRRQQLDEHLRKEILPMNILMMGPTGTGKTEIARRLAQMVDAPFIKCEATKYTEVGIVGSSAEESIKDLVDKSIKMERTKRVERMKDEIDEKVEKAILARIPGSMADLDGFKKKLRNLELDNTKIEVASFRLESQNPFGNLFGGGGGGGGGGGKGGGLKGLNVMGISLGGGGGGGSVPRSSVSDMDKKNDRVPISEAREIIREFELNRALDEHDIRKSGIRRAEESGIIFLDEIDKLCSDNSYRGDYKGVKGEGVQKELLGLIEGTTVQTDYGQVHTDHVLFIAAGAFHQSKPSDLLPELQGRLPIRVELEALTQQDFVRILTETETNLIEQQQALFGAEGVDIEFTDEAVNQIADYSRRLNESVDNIGARRLRAVISKVLEDISFDAPDRRGQVITIDMDFVETQLKDIVQNEDLSKYIL